MQERLKHPHQSAYESRLPSSFSRSFPRQRTTSFRFFAASIHRGSAEDSRRDARSSMRFFAQLRSNELFHELQMRPVQNPQHIPVTWHSEPQRASDDEIPLSGHGPLVPTVQATALT